MGVKTANISWSFLVLRVQHYSDISSFYLEKLSDQRGAANRSFKTEIQRCQNFPKSTHRCSNVMGSRGELSTGSVWLQGIVRFVLGAGFCTHS